MAHRRPTRRSFLRGSAGVAGALAFPMVVSSRVFGANDRVNVACIGVGGKGEVDVNGASVAGGNIAFLCDVDESRAAGTMKKFPSARHYKDFRRMLEKEGKDIDAVTVSTPDHVHAPAALTAMRMGKHVYCQKPLTHTVHEARLMAQVAKEKKLATQMGNQGHSDNDMRRNVELVRAGVIGTVREAHVWTDRPIWPQGLQRPSGEDPVPAGLDWDLWLGPAPVRPFVGKQTYVPFNWRGWWDFGTGALGDMACHCMDLVFFSVHLGAPTALEAESSGLTDQSPPTWSIIRYQFPNLKMTWYDGHKLPPQDLVKGKKLSTNGVILVGDKDTLYVPSYWGPAQFLSGAKTADFKNVPQTLPRARLQFDDGHYAEWIDAIKGGPAPMSNFADYSGPLSEAVLLGNVALRVGKRIEWDSKNLKVTNDADANRLIRKQYRKGWEVDAVG
jgi:predicted dehydrogenase